MSGREVFFMLATGVLWAAISNALELSAVAMILGGIFFGAVGQILYSELVGD